MLPRAFPSNPAAERLKEHLAMYEAEFARTLNSVFPSKDSAIREAQQILDKAGVKASIVFKSPEWKPGDVLVVRYNGPTAPAYTYVRGMRGWPGERQNKTDAQMSELYAMGKAQPVLQAGGVPFARTRLP